MAATCVAQPARNGREGVYCRPRILKSTTGWAERVQFQVQPSSEVRVAGTYHVGGRRDALHTANSFRPTKSTPTSRNIHTHSDTYQRVSVLVAALLQTIAQSPSTYGTLSPENTYDGVPLACLDDEVVARACIVSDSDAPHRGRRAQRSSTEQSPADMDFSIDFGSSSGFKSHAKKKKAAQASFDPWTDNSGEKKDDAGANGAGGDSGLGGGNGGDANGAGGGGDDNNGGGNDDDDDWGFSKKPKKKSKKKQEEEEEEERRRKEEEEANAAAGGNADPLSWADDANGETEDWTTSWGGAKKKDKKKKGDAPAAPDAPPATNAFQDIDLDDSAPKLDFSFDGIGDTKKSGGAGGGFSNWGKSWDFDGIGKTEEKKEEASDLGNNNPWGFGGSKTKKKATTMSNFDFGDFGSSNQDDLNFGAGNDVAETKPADDAWGFASTGKKDKKKKGAIEEMPEEPPAEPEQKEEDNWGGWGGAKKATKSSKKKNAFDDAFAATTETDNAAEPSFDWGFGKDKQNDLIGRVDDVPAAKEDEGDDWMSGAWGAGGKKKNKKKTDDLSASFDMPPPPPEAPEPPPPIEVREPLVAWDFGLNAKDKKKKQKQMQLEGSWMDRITQEMVDAAEAEAAATVVVDPEPVYEPEPEFEPVPPPPPFEKRIAWDHGLTGAKKRKKEKDMRADGTWDSRVTQEDIDAENAAADTAEADVVVDPEPEAVVVVGEAEADSAPLEELQPWDYMLSSKDKKKKEKELRARGEWDDRLTQDKINQMIFDRDNAAVAPPIEVVPEFDPEPEAVVNLEAEEAAEPGIPLEDLVPWDHGLTGVKKRKKEKDMRAVGTWEDRLTQEKIDQMIFDRDNAAAAPPEEFIPEPELVPEPVIVPEAEPAIPLEDLVPWDHGLVGAKKRKKEKDMRLEGTWEDRLTQEKIDQMVADRDAAATNEPSFDEPELVPEPEPEPVSVPAAPIESLEELEQLVPWDHNLNAKDKKKKEKSMRQDGTWDGRLTQESIDERIASARAAAPAIFEPEPEPEPFQEPEPESVVEERVPWDHGLSKLEKKKKEKQMKAEGTWENRLTQERIDDEAADAAFAAAEPEPEPEPIYEEPVVEVPPEPRVPWDSGLSPKDKKKKEKQMKIEGTWDNRLTQEKIDEEEAAKTIQPEPEPEPEPLAEEPVDNGWSFGWGASKTKPKKSLLEPEPEENEEKAEESWGGGGWGFGLGKDKKKKGTTPVVEEPEPIFEPEPEPAKDENVDDIWSFGATTKDKKKKDKGAKKSDLFDPPAEEPQPEPAPAAEDDMWASLSKPEKKTTKKGKKGIDELPPSAPTPEPETEPAALPSVDDFSWGGLDTGRKSNKSLAEEAPAKKSSSSMWGFGSSSSTAKTKKEKEKEAKAKQEEEERLQHEAEEAEAAKAEAERLAAEAEAKPSKKTKAGKLTKTTSKLDERKKGDDLLDLLDEPAPTPASTSSKLKKTSSKGSDKKLEEVPEEENKPQSDYFSFWGGSSNAKKTTGKKSSDNKNEIKPQVLTNEEDALLAELNEDEIQAILDDAPAPSSSKLTKTMINGKTKVNSSIADRTKAFESKKEEIGKTSKVTSAALIGEEEAEVALTPKEAKKAAKPSAKSSRSKVDQPPPAPPVEEQKRSKDSIPGGFPGAFGDDDDLLADEPFVPEPPPEPMSVKAKKSSKVEKVEKKSSKATSSKKKSLAFEETVETVPEPEAFIDDVDLLDAPGKLPTPPPESEKTKKERPRVERSATTSWGFWGASAPTPKKPTRSKTAEDLSAPATKKSISPPNLTRSKSTKSSSHKTTQDNKDFEKASKTSGSDKEGSGKQSDRPKPSRGMSFTNFMMGAAPPSAMRTGGTLKRSNTTGSKSSSRRQSMVDSGLLSPPPEDENPISAKAAKLMGFTSGAPKRRPSTKEKSRSHADPYPIDDDDMVVIHATDKETGTQRSKPKNKVLASAKRSSTKPRSKTISGDEDVVMVDSPIAMDSANEDLERPQLQRSNTGRKSFFGSFFGSGSKTPAENPRSAPATDNEDNVPPSRSRGNSHRRSRVISPADGFTTDAPGETDADIATKDAERRAKRAAAKRAEEDERLAREQRRRERREREKADLEARRERAREQARKEREAEEQRKEEKRARRREKEAAERARMAQEEAEIEAAAERRREERRRLREQLEAEAGMNPLTKDDRRRTYAGEEEARTRRKGDRPKPRTKESSGRRSTALMAEYHESRSGSGRGVKPPENKTSSWIDSQKDEPPELPPIEPTVLDASGQIPRPVEDGASGSRRRHKDKYAGMTENEITIARAKRRERKIVEKEKSTSGGSDDKTQKKSSKRQSRIVEDDYYANADPVRTFDGRPQQAKRHSFLGKFF